MKRILITIFSIALFYSCTNDTQKNNKNEQAITEETTQVKIIGFSITSKIAGIPAKYGTDVSTNEMITKNLVSGEEMLFKGFKFSLENEIEGALNFYSKKGKLMCEAPTELSIMSMPPKGAEATTYLKGSNIEFSGTTLIKIGSLNFVISNIKTN